MSGKRQHFIPQFLLRGFSSHSTRYDYFTWVFRKGCVPFNTNIKNIGVEGQFYSMDGESFVDDSITLAESSFGDLVAELREVPNTTKVDSMRVAELIAHLEARTRHFRQNFLESGTYLLDQFLKFAADPALFGDYMRRKISQDPHIMTEALSKELDKNGITQTALPAALIAIQPFLADAFTVSAAQMAPMVQELRKGMPAKLKDAAKTGHLRALSASISPEVKVRIFSKLTYRIARQRQDAAFVLGDSVVLFAVASERRFKTFYEKDDQLLAVLLPVSSEACLIGTTDGQLYELDAISKAVASCSLEFFIASQDTPLNRELGKSIASKAHIISRQEIEEIIDDVLDQ